MTSPIDNEIFDFENVYRHSDLFYYRIKWLLPVNSLFIVATLPQNCEQMRFHRRKPLIFMRKNSKLSLLLISQSASISPFFTILKTYRFDYSFVLALFAALIHMKWWFWKRKLTCTIPTCARSMLFRFVFCTIKIHFISKYTKTWVFWRKNSCQTLSIQINRLQFEPINVMAFQVVNLTV